jgi:cytochrome d ubiquinol oxidase subunit II
VTGLDGHHIAFGATGAGASNPIAKQVVLVHGGWLANFRAHGALWLIPIAALAGAIGTWTLLGMRLGGAAFLTSCVALAATILTAGVALFPFLMPSATQPNHGLTIWDASSSQHTLGVMLGAVIVFLPIVLAYTAWVYRVLRGRVTLEEMRRHTGIY